MDGTGALFGDFVLALGDGVASLVIAYPASEALDYQALTRFVRERLPGGEPFVLLGESFSGPIAIALAATSPQCIGLILCCSFCRNPIALTRKLQSMVAFLPISANLTPAIAPILLGRHPLPQLRSVLATVAPAVIRARLREVLVVDYSDQMGKLTIPVLYVQASRDRVVPASAARHLHTLCPAMQVVPVDAPHLLLQAAPGPAAKAIRAFIASLPV